MPAQTRTSTKNADCKVYYSKKVPRQKYFPTRRKVVRDKPTQDVRESRQATFLAERMRLATTLVDSEDDGEKTTGEEAEASEFETTGQRSTHKTSGLRGKKRKSVALQGSRSENDDVPVGSIPKRLKRKSAASERKFAPAIVIETDPLKQKPSPDHDEQEPPPSKQSSKSERQEETKRRGRPRQSTMTQLVDGRRPRYDDEEPQFEPVKRNQRKNWRNRRKTVEHHKQQKTLTQMVPGLIAPDFMSDDQDALSDLVDERDDESASEEYLPTQFKDDPISSTERVSRHTHEKPCTNSVSADQTPRKQRKSRFSLLATPERRKIREIASSQSPFESPLSTQVTPRGAERAPLIDRTTNTTKVQDTPSRRKQVTFQEPVRPTAPPCLLRKFISVVQDSEDEGEEEYDLMDFEAGLGNNIGAETQALVRSIEVPAPGQSIGTDTQAMLEKIDQACAFADEDAHWNTRDASEELQSPSSSSSHSDISLEGGEQAKQCFLEDDEDLAGTDGATYSSSDAAIKQEPGNEHVSDIPVELRFPPLLHPSMTSDLMDNEIPAPEPLQSPSMVIKNEKAEVEMEAPPMPLHQRFQTQLQRSHPQLDGPTDLDGEPVQVPRSPSPDKAESQETETSHSSGAEQQLQSEWMSRSQFPRAPPSSSMHVAHDGFSYQATPFARQARKTTQQPSLSHISQATTAVYTQASPKTTPHTPRVRSTHATPRRMSDSQDLHLDPVSPEKPPSLVIPSSFPSPGVAAFDHQWSSPVLEMREAGPFSQIDGGASVEDFSIPPLPPVDDDAFFED